MLVVSSTYSTTAYSGGFLLLAGSSAWNLTFRATGSNSARLPTNSTPRSRRTLLDDHATGCSISDATFVRSPRSSIHRSDLPIRTRE